MTAISRLLQISVICLATILATSAYADDKITDLLTTLSTAKAQAEGRASRVQNCISLKDSRTLEGLTSKYDDARNPYNGRLDAWMFVLRNRRSVATETALEPEKLDAALANVRSFIESADRALGKAGCPAKVIWKEVGVAIITNIPQIAEAISNLLKSTGADDKEREELIKALEQRKMKPWTNISVILVFDWSTDEFVADEKITDAVLRKSSTSVYVNKWALKRNPGSLVVVDKLPPEGLGDSYFFYTGKIDDLKRFTGAIK